MYRSIYEHKIYEQINHIFLKKGDLTPIKFMFNDSTNRQEILFMQYEMEKTGKNFKTNEKRIFRIDDGQIVQVNKNGQKKILSTPIKLNIEDQNKNKAQWGQNCKQSSHRIIMQFKQRSQIFVYFKDISHALEIGTFIAAKMNKEKQINFNRLIPHYHNVILDSFINCLKKQHNIDKTKKIKHRKTAILNKIAIQLNDTKIIEKFLFNWHGKQIWQNNSKIVKLKLSKIETNCPILEFNLKIWVNRQVKMCFKIQTKGQINKFSQTTNHYIETNQFFSVLSQSMEETIQFQLQNKNQVLRSSEFHLNDLKKFGETQLKINLKNKKQLMLLSFSFIIEDYCMMNNNKVLKINPTQYPMIDQLVLKNQQSVDPTKQSNIHKWYCKQYNRYKNLQYSYVQFSRCKQLFKMLSISDLITKFYTTKPFNQFINVNFKGTFAYEFLLNKSKTILFYDVQSLLWKFGDSKNRRIMIALKSFDENPRIIFTDPIYYLSLRLLELVQNESILYQDNNINMKSQIGRQSLAFYLTLAIIKTFPSLLIYQHNINNRALQINSLLFHYIIKTKMPTLLKQINRLQINIQALFGTHMVTFFSSILHGQLFGRVLQLCLSQTQEKSKIIYHTLISTFMSILQSLATYQCSFISSQCFLASLVQFCENPYDILHLFNKITFWCKTSEQLYMSSQFQQLATSMQQFTISNKWNGNIGEITEQIFEQFTCYHYKNQADIRKIFLLLDKLQIEQCIELTISIYQQNYKIYQHHFKQVNARQLHHPLEIKLISLEELLILCSQNSNPIKSFYFKINPKQIPSNLYIHSVYSLSSTHLQVYCNRYAMIQIYITDNCSINILENPILHHYISTLLTSSSQCMKKNTLFCQRWAQTFTMRQNNFNLLYCKLGWYGNHYILPQQRMLHCTLVHNRSGVATELSSQEDLYAISQYARCLYGRSIVPLPVSNHSTIYRTSIKNGILLNEESNIDNSSLVHNSSNRLVGYVLQNTNINSDLCFTQFYFKLMQLPLIKYLTYQPQQFYVLATLTMHLTVKQQGCLLIFSKQGSPLICNLNAAKIHQLQQAASIINRLPQQMQFQYDVNTASLLLDNFLYWLRVNILIQLVICTKKIQYEHQFKKWPNKLIISNNNIPNYPIHHLYTVLHQTKEIYELTMIETQIMTSIKSYQNYALLKGKWKQVALLAIVKSPIQQLFYVESLECRNKYIIKKNDVILGQTDPTVKTIHVSEKDLIQMNDTVKTKIEYL